MLRIVPHAGPCLIFSSRQRAHIVRPYRWHTITISSTSLKTRLFPHHHIPGPSRLSHLHTKNGAVPHKVRGTAPFLFILGNTAQFPPCGAHLCSIQYYLRFWLGICRTSLAVSALRIMRYCPYSINSIIMLCAFCACSPIRQALSPAQNRSLPSPQSGQTNRPHKQSAGFSGQAGQCPDALSRSSA